WSSDVCSSDLLQGQARLFYVTEGQGLRGKDLIILMTFTGNQHDVTALRLLHGKIDCLRTFCNNKAAVGVVHAAQNVSRDGRWIFSAGIIVSHDDVIAQALGDTPHQRSLGFIAITAAAKDCPDATGVMFANCV